MTVPAGGPPPLDLRLYDALLRDLRGEVPTDAKDVEPEDAALAIEALLVHVRALRAVLRPFAGMYEPSDRDVERLADTCPVQWQYDMYGTQGLTLGDLKRAAAVWGAAQDGEAEA